MLSRYAVIIVLLRHPFHCAQSTISKRKQKLRLFVFIGKVLSENKPTSLPEGE